MFHLVAFLIIISLIAYITLDGFDIGTGIISPFFSKELKTKMINSIQASWDGNEMWIFYTFWLLFILFAEKYKIIFHAFYIPLLLMTVCIILRGISLKFFLKSDIDSNKTKWGNIFAFSSIGVGFFQGTILGCAIATIGVNHFTMNYFTFTLPFCIVCGIGAVIGYAILGVSWQIYKMDRKYSANLVRILCNYLALSGMFFIISLPLLYYQRPDITLLIVSNKIQISCCIVLLGINAVVFYTLYTKRFKRYIVYFLLSNILLILPLVSIFVLFYIYTTPFVDIVKNYIALLATLALFIILVYTSCMYYLLRKKNSDNFNL